MGSGNWQLPWKVEVTCVAQVEGACCGTNRPEENAAQRAGADVRARGLCCGGGGESVEGAEDREEGEEEEEGSRGAEKAECEECRDRWWEDAGAGGFGAGAEQAEVRSRATLAAAAECWTVRECVRRCGWPLSLARATFGSQSSAAARDSSNCSASRACKHSCALDNVTSSSALDSRRSYRRHTASMTPASLSYVHAHSSLLLLLSGESKHAGCMISLQCGGTRVIVR